MNNPSDALRVVVGHEEIMAILDRYGFVCGDPHSDCNRARAAIAQALENDARWRFFVGAVISEDSAARAAITAQPFPRNTEEGWNACIDSAIAAQQKEAANAR